ncbi:MAG: VWA domain-containing protein, partial [Desulfovibrio sp.]|nr:VWA domain-containing protein [Desulfovibrio sp.]
MLLKYCHVLSLLCCMLAGLMSLSGPAVADTPRPLLLEGKKSLYQRVISHPGAKLYSGSEANASVLNAGVKTFTAFYVYARKDGRIAVGVSDSKADGWIDAEKTTFWKQAITMLFTSRMGRMPVLFFKDHEALETTCVDEHLGEKVRQYTNMISQKEAMPVNFPVMAVEPPDKAVSEKNFYLLPVLNMDNSFGDRTKLLEVASIDPGIDEADAGKNSQSADSDLRSGFVFVIDTTISMKPYIDQTLDQVRTIYDELEKNPHGDKIAFAVVAFRSSVQRSPGLEYTAKVVSDFKNVKERAALEKALSEVNEATVSSHAFDEDSFAGVKEAVDKLNWTGYGSRIMLLVTDAGPLREGDAASSTKMSPAVLADYVKSNRIYITVVHLKTPSGAKNHAAAEKAYRELSRQADNQSSYIPLDASSTAKG